MDVEWATPCDHGKNCVLVGYREVAETFVITDSKNPGVPVLQFSREEWLEFVASVKDGKFDGLGN